MKVSPGRLICVVSVRKPRAATRRLMYAGRLPAAQRLEQFGCGAVRRNRVARRQEAAEAIAALGIGFDPATQAVEGLVGVEVRIATFLVGVPDVHKGTGHRCTSDSNNSR